MKLRTAIVEDQKPDAERLEQLLKKAFGEEETLCRRFVCGDDFLKEFPGEGYQVVFLDICMEGTNGIETARQLRAADPELLIVFVTSSPEYVWDAFPVHPFDYLLKPYCSNRIKKKSLTIWQGSCSGCWGGSSRSWRCALPARPCICR